MKLSTLYKRTGIAGLRPLAAGAGCNPLYLYQVATGRRRLSAALAIKLHTIDKRLTLRDLLINDSSPRMRRAAENGGDSAPVRGIGAK